MAGVRLKSSNIAYRFKNPYPFDDDVFLNIMLKEHSFSKKDVPLKVGQTSLGAIPGYVFESDKTQLNFQPQEAIFGLNSTDYLECLVLFQKLKLAIFDKSGGSKEDIEFLEIGASGFYTSSDSPIEIINSIAELKREIKVGPDKFKIYSFRLYHTSDELTKSLKKMRYWIDIKVEPLILNPNVLYWQLTYRETEEKTEDVWKNLPDFIEQLLIANSG